MDTATFKSIVYGLGYPVAALSEAGLTPNFWSARLQGVYLLASREGDWAVAGNFSPERMHLEFRDEPELAERLQSRFGICLHTAQELAGPVQPRPGWDGRDLAYWKPANQGEALFNWWD